MTTFDRFESTSRIAGGPIFSVLSARAVDGKGGEKYAIKVCRPPAEMGREQNERAIQRFLQQAAALRAAGAGGGRHWAPVHAAGRLEDGGFYVTDRYEMHLGRLISGRVQSDARSLHAIISAIVGGLVELQEASARPHGNLKASNVLMDRAGRSAFARIVLTDPLPREEVDADRHWPADLMAVGELLFALVEHREYPGPQAWPIEPGSEWRGLGASGEEWRQLCNALLAPEPTQRVRSLDELAERLTRLGAGGPGRKPAWAALIGLVIVALAVGGYFFLKPTPSGKQCDPNYLHWDALCDEFSITSNAVHKLYDIVLKDARSAGDQSFLAACGEFEELKQVISRLEAAKEDDLRLDPRTYVEGQITDYQKLKGETWASKVSPDDWCKIADAFTCVVECQEQVQALWNQLSGRVASLKGSSLPKLADYLDALIPQKFPSPEEDRLGYAGAVRELLDSLTKIDKVLKQEQLVRQAIERIAAYERDLDAIVNAEGDKLLGRYGDLDDMLWERTIENLDDLADLMTSLNDVVTLGVDLKQRYRRLADAYVDREDWWRQVQADLDESPVVGQSLRAETYEEHLSVLRDRCDEYDGHRPYEPDPRDDPLNGLNVLEGRLADLRTKVQDAPFTAEEKADLESQLSGAEKEVAEVWGHAPIISNKDAIDNGLADLRQALGSETDSGNIQARLDELVALYGERIMDAYAGLEDRTGTDLLDPSSRPGQVTAMINRRWREWSPTVLPDKDPQPSRREVETARNRLNTAEQELRDLESQARTRQPLEISAKPLCFDARMSDRLAELRRSERVSIVDATLDIGQLDDLADEDERVRWQAYDGRDNTVKSALAELSYVEIGLNRGYGAAESLPNVIDRSGREGRTISSLLQEVKAADLPDVLEPCIGNLGGRAEDITQIAANPDEMAIELVQTARASDRVETVFATWRWLRRDDGRPEQLVADVTSDQQFIARLMLERDFLSQNVSGAIESLRDPPDDGRYAALSEWLRGDLAKLEERHAEAKENRAEFRLKVAVTTPPVGVEVDVKERLRQVPEMKGDFGITEDLSERHTVLGYDLRLLTFLDGLEGDEELRSDETRLKGYVRGFVGTEADKGIDLADAPAREELIATLNNELGREGPDPFVPGALTEGPAGKEWDFLPPAEDQDAGNPQRPDWLTYDIAGHEVAFRLVEPPPDSNHPHRVTYLSVDEVPVGLFIDIIEESDPGSWGAVMDSLPTNIRGVRVWERLERGVGLGLANRWIPRPRFNPGYYPSDGGVWPLAPTAEHPMTRISPQVAVYVAGLAGCRLPTVGEWQAACAESKPDIKFANLRGARWGRLKEYLKSKRPDVAMRADQYPFPDVETFRDPDWPPDCDPDSDPDVTGRGGYQHATYNRDHNDGHVWFWETDIGEGSEFRNLVGNVHELVTDRELVGNGGPSDIAKLLWTAGTPLRVIGASALSQWVAEAVYSAGMTLPWLDSYGDDERGQRYRWAFADVGFRLAFSVDAPKSESLYDRLKREVLDKDEEDPSYWYLRYPRENAGEEVVERP
ncbi:MAG: hypothetical protein JSV91_13450 [Phycisphaerales bacterium]|nr:MAG: hypothetical protein JSV91_13450 [Phycisphaerales bacterium]